MFDSENVKDGVTLRVNRFESPNDGKLYASIILRIKGPKSLKAHDVFAPVIKKRKESAKLHVETLEEAMKPKMEAAKASGTNVPDDEFRAFEREHNKWLSRYSNPLFDFLDGEASDFIAEVSAKLREAGLRKVKREYESNGEISCETVHFS